MTLPGPSTAAAVVAAVLFVVAAASLPDPTSAFGLATRRGTMTMKRPHRRRRSADGSSSAPAVPVGLEPDGTTVIPQNLRRKVRASRPSLGHVVPSSSSRTKKRGGSAGSALRPQGRERDVGLNNPSNLRILGGTARGRKLDSPEVYLRPMMGKVREAVFSTFTSFGLYDRGSNVRHLDIFAGSGSVGLESLSRGAGHVTFVDFADDCCDAVERNVKRCGFDVDEDDDDGTGRRAGTERTRVVRADYLRALRDPESVGIPPLTTYGIVTLCPPYEEVVYADLIEAVCNSRLVTDDTVIMIEYPVELGCLPHVITREDGGKVIGVRNRKYGRTVIAMYVVNPTGRMEVASSRPEEFVSLR
uniref:Uncharacterized protein n=1 Tax=Trieres chinensis TaxID=1514140 RepID=A0A7S2EE12_TRICV